MMQSWRFVLLVAVAGVALVSSEIDDTECTQELYHPNGPRIFPCKKDVILQKGQNYTLTCRGNTVINFTQQDEPEVNIGNFSIKQRNVTNETAEYKYEMSLDLINIDKYAIGYYACKDNSVGWEVLNSLFEEPNNTEHVSYIYIYVNGTDSLFAPMREFVTGKAGHYIVECRPSTPDVHVELTPTQSNKKADYLKYSPKVGFLMKTCKKIAYICRGHLGIQTPEEINIRKQRDQPQPKITGGTEEFLKGETYSLNCTVNYTHNNALNLTWKFPNDFIKNTVIEDSNNERVVDKVLFRSITIVNATKDHAGTYTCFSKNNCGEKVASFVKTYLDNAKLIIKPHQSPNQIIHQLQRTMGLSLDITSYPPVNSSHVTYYKNFNIPIDPRKNNTYRESWFGKQPTSRTLTFKVSRNSVEDSGNYTIVITNGYQTENFTYDIRFKVQPIVDFGSDVKTCVLNRKTSLQCEITGYPLPDVKWIFTSNGSQTSMNSTDIDELLVYKERAILDIPCIASGKITCVGSNVLTETGSKKEKVIKTANQTRTLHVYEMDNGFGISLQTKDKARWFSENEDVSVKCLASKYEFDNVTWVTGNDYELGRMVEYSENQFSLVAKLKINNISLSHVGTYTCNGIKKDGKLISDDIYINVEALAPPSIIFTSDVTGDVGEYQPVHMNCIAQGVPRPAVSWKKDGELLFTNITESNVEIMSSILNRTTVNSTVSIKQMKEKNRGTYECFAVASAQEAKDSVTLVYRSHEAAYMKYLIVIAIITVVFIILLIYLICKIKKEKKFRKELAAAGLLYFKEGVTKSLNPDLGIDEQAELLPYDEKFEFPMDKLVFGKQLGAGAFGVVYKADARGIINAEETTPVAVKTVKKTADNMFIKALASELKIMVHLGKHVNIVNLLGACTKNVGKRELVVIVEYCKFGNIHNYMQRHREVFIDQFSDNNKEKSLGKVNRGYDSSGSTGVQSDYGTANTQDTDHTFLTNNTNRTSVSRKNVPSQPTEVKASEGYVQPEWRSNYECDYSYDGRSPRPLTSRDLLAWAFQIARGMEYLASRKVLHGDLAARNILLADDNIVKICDFGLARSIYKNDEYQKKENSLLPVKWLAIECMTDRIFSTQSDVWSFGIVLWELFSLAKTPYPNMAPPNLLQFLSEGKRLDKPAYSDDRIYSLMRRCWEPKPTMRPSFTQLQEILGTFLEDNVRNHYVDLNAAYMDLNSRPEGQEDYLAMMNSPDYNNLVTPSPHHYVNELNGGKSFFPNTPTKVDDEGYLQMSPTSHQNIFSPKPTSMNFDFDTRKFNSRPSEASSGGSELTPMLTLNNLPRSGSDSDHEGNASPSYPNACPRIEEETDEVFETKQYNAKNAQNSAVSNPTYITFDIDAEKKPMDINNYVNIVPNGLVK